MSIEPLDPELVERLAAAALAEDRAFEDVTTLATVPAGLHGRGVFLAKQAGIAAGFALAEACFRHIEPKARFRQDIAEGAAFANDDTIAVVEGSVQALLQAERVALNFVQRLGGTATLTRQFVNAVAGTRAVILDTRKTTPGLRAAEKYAVRCGGGTNHRPHLASMAMIKDNHREALRRQGLTLAQGVDRIRKRTPGVPVEVEVDSLAELEAALDAKPDWVLLDNMRVAEVAEAVLRTEGRAKLEASGGITLQTVRAIAGTGIDAISIGALTHSAKALDISLELEF